MLAHSMGLGKTLTTIALIDALLSSTALRNAARTGGVAGFRCVLVVAPATVLQNWCDEADKWSERAAMSYYYYHVKVKLFLNPALTLALTLTLTTTTTSRRSSRSRSASPRCASGRRRAAWRS